MVHAISHTPHAGGPQVWARPHPQHSAPSMGDTAQALARAGFAVFPVAPRGKTPITRRGLYDATRDPHQVRAFWDRWPAANIGIATAGLLVIDCDGPRGIASLAALETRFAALPDTVCVQTARGRHYYFLMPTGERVGNRAGLAAGLDIRGAGGYVVAPGSIHPSGTRYQLAAGTAQALALAPRWLIDLVQGVGAHTLPARTCTPGRAILQGGTAYGLAALKREAAAVASAPGGQRNDTLNRAAYSCGQLVAGGELAADDVRAALLDAADQAGLSAREALSTITSGIKGGARQPRQAPHKTKHGQQPLRPRPPAPPVADQGRQRGRPAQLTSAELLTIYSAESDSGICQLTRTQAATFARVSMSTIARLERELAAQGSIERVTSDDRRRSWLVLHPAGVPDLVPAGGAGAPGGGGGEAFPGSVINPPQPAQESIYDTTTPSGSQSAETSQQHADSLLRTIAPLPGAPTPGDTATMARILTAYAVGDCGAAQAALAGLDVRLLPPADQRAAARVSAWLADELARGNTESAPANESPPPPAAPAAPGCGHQMRADSESIPNQVLTPPPPPAAEPRFTRGHQVSADQTRRASQLLAAGVLDAGLRAGLDALLCGDLAQLTRCFWRYQPPAGAAAFDPAYSLLSELAGPLPDDLRRAALAELADLAAGGGGVGAPTLPSAGLIVSA